MRTMSYLFLSLLMCVTLLGCTEDSSGTGSANNGASDTNLSDTDLTDTGDATSDIGNVDASGDSDSADVGSGDCTVDDDCSGQPHQVGFCDTTTNTCTYTCDDGFDDCDADPTNGCEVDVNADTSNCGACGTTCDPTLNQLPICTAGTCDVDPDTCTADFVDLDGSAGNGCECEITDADDVPDAAGVDANCDGADGIIAGADANVVFVATDGDDTADGLSTTSPVQTLTMAIAIADSEDRAFVLAAGGTYVEQVTLKNGVSIHGGYDGADDFARDTDDQTTTIAPTTAEFGGTEMHYETLVADGIDQPTTLAALTIEGVDASAMANGASTYALWASDADSLTIEDSVIIAGPAAAGADGTDATGGADVLANGNCTPAEGGAGATADSSEKPCSASGNDGANANLGADGELADVSNNLGVGGLGGIHHCDSDGTDGEDGNLGTPGDDGDNGQALGDGIGSLDADGHWTLGAGTQPADGTNGGGGGGGGAGGNYETTGLCTIGNNCNAVGGNGGDGGNGGCAAVGSTNGEAGGGSFGVVIAAGTITMTDTTITLGNGGGGGLGGDGAGGDGGKTGASEGSPSGASGGASGAGGRGGEGGNGGDAGAGAGGCGGASFGIMTAAGVTFDPDTSVTIDDANALAAAAGRGGEAVDASFGPEGCDGEVAKTHAYTAP
jgi:hypothetical protein